MVHMVPFSFTITPPASPQTLASYPHFLTTRKSSETVIDMQRRIDTIAPTRPSHDDAEDPTESWSTPQSYNLDRAAAIAQKIAQEELALLTPAAVLQLGGNLGTPFEYELDHKSVRFAGLYVVNGPSESRHIRYAMEVSVPELQLRTRCIQRFQSFHQLRKRLLKVTKRCCHHYHQQYNNSGDGNRDSKLASLAATWSELPFTSATRGCRNCRRVRKSLKALVFPRRKVFTTSAVDVRQRSLQLETFLGACTRLLVDWSGCERGKKLFAAVVGKFLGVNILQQLFPSRYGRGSGYSSSLMDNHMEVVHAENGEATGGVREFSDGGFGGSEYAQSVATAGLSSRSESSYTTTTTGGGGSGFHVGGAPSCRTLLSTFSSSSSLSLHDEDDYQS